MRLHVVIATAESGLADGGDRLLQLATWLSHREVRVELVALGEGWDLDRYRSVAPTLVVDELRRRGPARLLGAVGLDRAARAVKSLRLRWFMRRRRHATFYIHHPLASSIVRYAPGRQPRLIAGLPDVDWSYDQLRDDDRTTLSAATGWIVADSCQVEPLQACVDVPVEVLGSLVDPTSFPAVDRPDPGRGAIAFIGAADPWTTVDCTIEIAWQLHVLRPTFQIRWLVADRRARWLALHDLRHADLEAAVDVDVIDSPAALRDLGALARTCAAPTGEQQMVAAALSGIPVIDCADPPLDAAEAFPVLHVEEVVRRLAQMFDDPSVGIEAGISTANRLPKSSFQQRAEAVLQLLTPS